MSRFRALVSVGISVAVIAVGATPSFAAGLQANRSDVRPTLATQSSGTLSRTGGVLRLGGQPYTFTGANAYELATDFAVNHGCGDSVTTSDLDTLFGALAPGSVVRMDAYQQLVVDASTGQLDWAPLDAVVSAAAAYDVRLDMVLSSQAGVCDNDLWHNPSWYASGYRQTYSDGGRNIESYWQFVGQIVQRYAKSPAIAFWEPVSEPDVSTCAVASNGSGCYGVTVCQETSAAQTLRAFFTAVGGRIHSLDPSHLVAAGFIGTDGQCGTNGSDYGYVAGSPGLDVLTYHDYGDDQISLPATLSADLAMAKAAARPLIVEESGMSASITGTPVGGLATCWSYAQREALTSAKMSAAFAAGAAGYLVWDWVPASDPTPSTTCTQNITPNDPMMARLAEGT